MFDTSRIHKAGLPLATARSGGKAVTSSIVWGAALLLVLALWATPAAAGKGGTPVDTGTIAFLREDLSARTCELVLLDLNPRQEFLTLPACTFASEGALPPASWSHSEAVRWLLFRRRTAGALDGFWAMLEDGTGMHQVIPQASADYFDPFHPNLSRDDRWMAFTAKAPGSTTYDVFIQSFDPLTATVTAPPVNLTQGTLAAKDVVVFSPSLPSSGQSSIAFTAVGAGGLRDIFRMDLSFGTGEPEIVAGPTNLTNTSKSDEGGFYGLDWSVATAAWPDGRLAFGRGGASSGGSASELVQMAPAPGATPVLVTRDDARGKVSWSPSADRILYSAYTTGNASSQADVSIVSPDGSGKVNITGTRNLYEVYPTWRP